MQKCYFPLKKKPFLEPLGPLASALIYKCIFSLPVLAPLSLSLIHTHAQQGLAFFSWKGPDSRYLSMVGCVVSVAATERCPCRVTAATDHVWVGVAIVCLSLLTPALQKAARQFILAVIGEARAAAVPSLPLAGVQLGSPGQCGQSRGTDLLWVPQREFLEELDCVQRILSICCFQIVLNPR